ncbi:MAG: FAD-dependent oxidoreductase [Thermofilum sp.]
MISADVAVLGCGWAGVLAALELKSRAPSLSVVCVDADKKPGGLLRSEELCGHVFDIGGSHVIFSKSAETLSEILSLLEGNYVQHERKSYVLYKGVKVPYPFENGLHALPPGDRAEMLVSFVEALVERAASAREPASLQEWIRMFFGRAIAEAYLEPYNRKIWKHDPSEIDIDWVYTPGRLPFPDWRDVVRSGAGIETRGYLEQARFYYPAKGGIQALYDAARRRAEALGVAFLWGEKVSELRRDSGKWLVNRAVEARRVFSTIPLRELVAALKAPEDVIRAAEKLRYNRVAVVGLALRKPAPPEHWVYVPQGDVVFHRYAWISNYSEWNAPRGSSTLQAEITLRPEDRVKEAEIFERTLEGLEKLGVAGSEDVKAAGVWVHEYGYPVYLKGHRSAREEVARFLGEAGVVSVGRWGSWHYWNMDRVYVEVKSTVSRIV